jgi:hypothetical protein
MFPELLFSQPAGPESSDDFLLIDSQSFASTPFGSKDA